MQIKYGTSDNNIDVTEICYTKLLNKHKNIIYIPRGETARTRHFTDPVNGVLKQIFIITDNNVLLEYDYNTAVNINSLTGNIYDYNMDINKLHNKLQIQYGSFNEELPEQLMAVRYLTGNEKVLEIGGNIGRNSLIIGSILGNNKNNFVTLESDPNIATQLTHNRDLNNMDFHIESSALSNIKLIQKGWDTIASDELLPGYTHVNIVSWTELNNKYNINFDTLVLDCEGAFYYILMDMPEMLKNISLIIMENDYWDMSHKNYVDDILLKNNFYVDYSECGGWGPCFNKFFEVWKRDS
jgi:FkbM family methyltransferase